MEPVSPFTFATPPRILVGWGAATDGRLATEAARLGGRPLIVASQSLRANGILDAILDSLRKAGLLPVRVHVGVPPEPSLDDLQACVDAASDCDSVIALGGGSVLDVAKGAAALAGTSFSVHDYFDGRAAVPERGQRPILAAPTTSGTGSEVTWVGVFSDKRPDAPTRKASIRGGAMMPSVAVLDAQLTISCPRHVTIHSGLDAFVQALEAYTSIGANPMTDALALEAARLASYANVAVAAENPDDRTAREAVALGSLMAGMALNTSRLGLVHGLAHPIGAITGAAHGLICGMLLLPVMRFNRSVAATKYAQIAETLLPAITVKQNPEAADRLMDEIEECFYARLSLPRRLSEIGLREGDLARVATEAIVSGSTKANPRPVTKEDAWSVTASCL